MKKQWYDHKSRICDGCHFHRPEGERSTEVGTVYYPEGCGNYGYSFHEYPELADDCEGFITTTDYTAKQRANELLKKKKR